MVPANSRVILVLDALNQLEDREGALDLIWLPQKVPANIRLVLSTLPGRPLNDLRKRGWPTLYIEPLNTDERKRLVSEYLNQYAKELSPARIERIVTVLPTANPLYLCSLLEELRLFGIHERLDERIEHYLAAQNVSELYARILDRWQQDYDRERPRLVGDTLSLLWASRRGLQETELMDLLGRAGEDRLPQAIWSPFYLAAERSLVSRSGLIGFSHEYLRRAVRDRYLPVMGEQAEAHLKLAYYFDKQDLVTRKVEELPWQLSAAESWEPLYKVVADAKFFQAAWRIGRFDVESFWARLEEHSYFAVE